MPKHTRIAIARNAFSNAAMEAGFDAFLPVCPGSADVILYRRKDGDVRLVLLRDRWTVGEEHECLQVREQRRDDVHRQA